MRLALDQALTQHIKAFGSSEWTLNMNDEKEAYSVREARRRFGS
jgi:hypothetical protein